MVQTIEQFSAGVKGLPRDPNTGQFLNVFEAGGQTFYILTGSDAFPVSRWTQFAKFNTMFLASADMTNAYARRQKMDEMFNDIALGNGKHRISDVIVANRAEMEELKGMSEARFETGLYLATLFIVAKGEDSTQWSFAQAEEKIKAWADEKYSAEDFFVLAAHYAAAFIEKLNNYLIVASGGQSAVISGSGATE